MVIDALGRHVPVPPAPRRIVSLCPSQTETLLELGLGDRVVGRTRYCIHPAGAVDAIAHVDGTKRPDVKRILELAPDLVIAEKEENTPETVAALEKHVPVYVTDVKDIASATQMIRTLGRLTGTELKATAMAGEIERAMASLKPLKRPLRAAYLIWRKPTMGAASTTFIDSVLERCGFVNVLREIKGRYPELAPEALRAAAPEVILLSSEPYPFAEKHVREYADAVPGAHVRMVDGEMFSWYGARMRLFAAYLDPLLRELESSAQGSPGTSVSTVT